MFKCESNPEIAGNKTDSTLLKLGDIDGLNAGDKDGIILAIKLGCNDNAFGDIDGCKDDTMDRDKESINAGAIDGCNIGVKDGDK